MNDSNSGESKKSNLALIVGVGFGVVATILAIIAVFLFNYGQKQSAATVVADGLAATEREEIGHAAKISAARMQCEQLIIAIDMYQHDNGKYPATLNALVEGTNSYLNSGVMPLDPWKNPYKYVYPGKHPPLKYDLWSVGPDGIDGDDDDIANWKFSDADK